MNSEVEKACPGSENSGADRKSFKYLGVCNFHKHAIHHYAREPDGVEMIKFFPRNCEPGEGRTFEKMGS